MFKQLSSDLIGLYTKIIVLSLIITVILSTINYTQIVDLQRINSNLLNKQEININEEQSYLILNSILSLFYSSSGFALLVLSNIIYLKLGNFSFFLITLLYFVGFTIFDYGVLSEGYSKAIHQHLVNNSQISLSLLKGLFISANSFIWVTINFLLIRMIRSRNIKLLRKIARLRNLLRNIKSN